MKSQLSITTKSGFIGYLTRREIFKATGLSTLVSFLGCTSVRRLSLPERIKISTYKSLGVKTPINCTGTMTSLGGSLELPEVKMAMEEASKHYVRMDDLMECVGRRLAELTGAEWGCVTSGAACAMFAATAACIAGADPEKMALLPDTTGMKNEVLVPVTHRHIYDRAIWMVGAKMIEVKTAVEMEAAVNDHTVMIAVLGEILDRSDISLEDMVRIGKKHNIPVMVDAAAERPDVPNVYIKAGVDLVAYSGGKCLRGPQCAGLLLGRKDLVKAAFLNISPHHSVGRPMKVGKEEIMGTLASMEMWVNRRDHKAEWKEWERKLRYISEKVTSISTVKPEIILPQLRSNVAPRLSITWNQKMVKISPGEVRKKLFSGNPCIEMPASRNGMSIMSYMLEPGDEMPVGRRLYEVLSQAV